MKRLEWANALRGVAALTVLVAHYGVAFWMNQGGVAGLARREPLYDGSSGAPRFARLLAAVPVDLAALGVGLFFLISGYVIAISLDRYSRRGFIIGRCMRVLPTYAAGYLVTCLVVWAAGDPANELLPTHVLAGMVPGLTYVVGIPALADGIVWTLIVELVFYAVCLLVYRSLTRRWYAILAVGVACVALQLVIARSAAAIPFTAGRGLAYIVLLAAPFLPVMLIGVVLSAYRRGQLAMPATLLLVPALTGVHLVLMSTTEVVPTPLKYRLTFVGTIGLFALVSVVGDRWRSHPVTGFFADISYPLYVVHAVLGYVLLSLLTAGGLRAPAAILVAAATAIVVAWLVHRVVEEPTHRLGQRWARAFAYRPDDAAPLPIEDQREPSTVAGDEPTRQVL